MEKYLRQLIRETLVEGNFVTASGKSVEYGTPEHIQDLEMTLNDLVRIRNRQGRTSKSRYIYARAVEETRKQLRSAQRYASRNGLLDERQLRTFIRVLLEGGLKAPGLTGNTVLNPETVARAIGVYRQVIELWNEYLTIKGRLPVEAIGPVGSVAYFKKDLAANSDTTYGDVDYLVAFPVEVPADASPAEERQAENDAGKDYTNLLVDFLKTNPKVRSLVHVDATLRSSPKLLIIRLPDNKYVQVDTIVTYPHYVSKKGRGWMPAAWTPERGIKGYVLSSLYSSMADRYGLSFSDRGVMARTRDGKVVPFRMRKNTKLHRVSADMSQIFADVASYLTKGALPHKSLAQQPGMDPDNLSIRSAAKGIVGLVQSLASAGVVDDVTAELVEIHRIYKTRLQAAIDRKKSRGLEEDKYDKLGKVNAQAVELVAEEFKI